MNSKDAKAYAAFLAEQPELAWLRVRSKEWHHAWRGLARLSGDTDNMAECPLSYEVWQYMGSCLYNGRWKHEFRHRNHPRTNTRLYFRVPSTPGWKPLDEKVIRRRLH
jgi:hypothetical protein